MDAQFRLIEGFPGYRVSREGEVQSRWGRGYRKTLTDTWRPLKPIRRGPYLSFNLSDGSKKTRRYAHRLVLETWTRERPRGRICCHNDGDAANNRVENLRWDSYRANEADKLRHGTRRVGSAARSKLREEDVLEIRRRSWEGIKFTDLAKAFGVCRQNVEAIVHRRSWRHLA